MVNLLNFFGREEEREYRAIEGRLKTDILEKRKQIEGEAKELLEAEPENIAPFLEFFNRRFIWTAGEYEILIKVKTENSVADVARKYRFTIFEYYEEELRSATDGFKYGDGIYWDSNISKNVVLDIKEA